MRSCRLILIWLVGLVLMAPFQNCSAPKSSEEAQLGSQSSIEAFKSTLHPTLRANCTGCHGSNQNPVFASLDPASSHQAVLSMNLVSLSAPSSSRLVTKIMGGHQGFGSPVALTIESDIAAWARLLSGTSSSGGGGTGGTGSGTSGQLTASFTSIKAKILDVKCLSCHRTGNAMGGVRFDNYATTLAVVWPGNPAGSKLYTEVQSGRMPKSSAPLSSTEVKAIGDWILAGANNN